MVLGISILRIFLSVIFEYAGLLRGLSPLTSFLDVHGVRLFAFSSVFRIKNNTRYCFFDGSDYFLPKIRASSSSAEAPRPPVIPASMSFLSRLLPDCSWSSSAAASN